jgi:ATP-binding cassette subfamily F protein uup
MPLLTARDMHKAYGARPVLAGAELHVARGEKVGLVGRNGSGKSTLLRCLAAAEALDAGHLALRNGTHVAYVPQNPDPGRAQTLLDVAMAGTLRCRTPLEPYEQQLRATQALKNLGIADPEIAVAVASGGTLRRAALAAALLQEPDLLLLDEPTNHLDAETVAWLETQLRQSTATVVLVTHDRWFLNQVVDRIVELRAGQLRSYLGTFQDYLETRVEEDALADRLEARRKNLLRIELDWLGRSPAARSTRPKARLQRAEALVHEVREVHKPLRLPDLGVERLGKTVLEARSLTAGWPGVVPRVVVRGLDLTLVRGDRLGLVGPNGAGKTTLLQTLIGAHAPLDGQVRLGQHTHVLAIDQHRSGLEPTDTVQQAASVSGSEWIQFGDTRQHVAAYLEQFLFRREDLVQQVSTLSGGQRFRLLLARRLQEPMNVLVLDEPTNDLDLETLQVLEEALGQYPGCALVVSHDRAFLDRVCTGILHVVGDGSVQRHQGNYTQFLQNQLDRERAARLAAQPIAAPPRPSGRAEAPPKLTWSEEKRLAGIEAEIEAVEQIVAGCEAQLAAVATDFAKTQQAVAAHAEATARRDALWEEWNRLEAKQAMWQAFKRGEP